MNFSDPREVEQVCYQLKLADYPRSQNRARINELFNGFPPYNDQEVNENNITINVNDLSSTRTSHDARAQFYSAFMKPGNYFKATTDRGPKHKRTTFSTIFTSNMNRIMKRSLLYFECMRSKFASGVLHGIGPSAWQDRDRWCPSPLGIEDVLVPANTLLTMENLPFFAIYRSFTAPELIRMTRGANVDKGWNMEVVNACIEYIDQETMSLLGSNWPEIWSPEKMQERVKGDGGFYVGDAVPTINVFDFYFWNDDDKVAGWNRRMIIDAWSTVDGVHATKNSRVDFTDRKFLFDSGNRKYADKREELISFQFADLSAVAPFRYHSVRSLGFLLYAVCHLQNRLRCRFNESVFEALTMYFRVRSQEEGQRALKLLLTNRGLIDDSLQFVPAGDRFQVNADLVNLGLKENQALIEQNSSSYTQNQNFSKDRVEKTKFQVMAEVNAINSLVSAALLQAYQYQNFEYYEIVRRFCRADSRDVDVVRFRSACIREGLPEKLLSPEAWDVEPERVLGAGNKTLEMAIAQQLMEYRNLFDPEPQRAILRDMVLAVTDDPGRADNLVPEAPVRVSDSVHDAQLASGTLMQNLPVAVKTGINHIEYVEAMLASMALVIKNASKTNMATMEQIMGMNNLNAHIQAHIAIIAQDPKEKARVKTYQDQLAKMMNLVKAFAQRLQEQMQAQGQNGNGADPEAQAKVENDRMMTEAKMANTRESHAQRTAQRQIQFEQEEQRAEQEHKIEMEREREKLEMEREKMQMELQLEREKMQMEMQLEREKADLQMQVEREKAEAQKQAAKAQARKPRPSSE